MTASLSVLGDFSVSSLTMRLYAPNFEALLQFLPDATEEQSVENWQEFAARQNWYEEGQGILYVANFLHEFVHLLQHTTLATPSGHVTSTYDATRTAVALLYEMRDEGTAWPPKLPLVPWLDRHGGERAEEFLKRMIELDVMFQLYQGNEDFAKHYTDTLGLDMATYFVEPFVPRIGHLLEGAGRSFGPIDRTSITTTMLLESQATAWEYRYVGAFFGQDIAHRLCLGQGDRLRPNYDLLPTIAILDDLLFFLPLVIDWALDASAIFRHGKPDEYTEAQPSWRFLHLYNATKTILAGNSAAWRDTSRLEELRHLVYEEAGFRHDDSTAYADWLEQLPESPIRSVLRTNIRARLQHPTYFALLEAFLARIQAHVCTPLVIFRDRSWEGFHPGVRLETLEQVVLEEFGHRFWEIGQMILGNLLRCPFCNGASTPPVGRRTIGVEGQEVSRFCRCGWAFRFHANWGVSPDDIEPMED